MGMMVDDLKKECQYCCREIDASGLEGFRCTNRTVIKITDSSWCYPKNANEPCSMCNYCKPKEDNKMTTDGDETKNVRGNRAKELLDHISALFTKEEVITMLTELQQDAEYKEPVIRDIRVKNELDRVKNELEPTTKNCESCKYYGSHHEVCNYCYKCSLWTEGEPTTKNDLVVDCVSRKEVEKLVYRFLREGTDENIAFYEHLLDLPSVIPQKSRVDFEELKRKILMKVDGGTDDAWLAYGEVCNRISNSIDEFVSDMRGEEV